MKRVALITGGSRGIGFGCAEHLARVGFDLAINGVREEKDAAPALDALRALGAEVVY
ncbi:MAG TPA: SDR family NAD(P)-dependent oxidoreductase, partial [Opitutales bacterium]|nr:SDR family NAD(P)-dependent oxidoreductase [Opitutales bacterium]